VGHYAVRPGHTVYINDSTIFHNPGEDANLAQNELRPRDSQVPLRIFSDAEALKQVPGSVVGNTAIDATITGYTALFGADLTAPDNPKGSLTTASSIRRSEGISVRREASNRYGCVPFEHNYPDSALVVHRGRCTFLEKLLQARAALSSTIIIISDENVEINPTANPEELMAAGDLSNSAIVLLLKKTGEVLEEVLTIGEKLQASPPRISVHMTPGRREESERTPMEKKEQDKETIRILHVNGHPLINTRLLV